VASYTFVNPVVAVVAGWLVLGERPAPVAWLGIVLVIGAVVAGLATERGMQRQAERLDAT
jgi:drug/metabolite transporter (DMT)-like permease